MNILDDEAPPPNTKKWVMVGKHRVSPRSIAVTVITIAVVVILIISILGLAAHYLLGSWAWIVGAFVICILTFMLVKYARRQGAKKIFEKYGTDMTVIGFSLFGIIALNFLILYLTSARPQIWRWYWGNQAFFWAWNAGWVIVAFLSSKRDEKGVVIPTAAAIRRYTLYALVFGFAINLFFYGTRNNTLANDFGNLFHGSNSNKEKTQLSYTQVLEVPAGAEVEKDVPMGFDFHWGKSEGAFLVENDKGAKARFDPANGLFENLPMIGQGENRGFSKKLKFKSLSDKPAKVILEFTKQS